jgi:hypothetical protein
VPASNADTLVSIGGVQSNHTRMVAAVAAKIGMNTGGDIPAVGSYRVTPWPPSLISSWISWAPKRAAG